MAGRPLKFKTPEDLQVKVEGWYEERKAAELPLTVTSLALALGTTRDLLIDYADKDGYSDTITRAKAICHCYAEDQLFIGRNSHGAQFNLKNNWGWKDVQGREIAGKDGGPIQYSDMSESEIDNKIEQLQQQIADEQDV